MTAYGTPLARTSLEAVKEVKEKRRQVLEAAERTRKANYERFLQRMAALEKSLRKKHRLQAISNLV